MLLCSFSWSFALDYVPILDYLLIQDSVSSGMHATLMGRLQKGQQHWLISAFIKHLILLIF